MQGMGIAMPISEGEQIQMSVNGSDKAMAVAVHSEITGSFYESYTAVGRVKQ